MATVHSLSGSDVAAIRAELSAGKQVTVWFTPHAVGVPPGGSAKVMSVGDVAEGEFIEVRPAGSRDTMFCSSNELTTVRPPRRRAPRPESPEPVAAPGASRARSATRTAPAAPEPAPAGRGGGSPAPVDEPPEPVAAPEPPATRKSTQRRPVSAEVTITLAASVEGEWNVEVTVGKKRVVRSMPVQPTEVAKAARSLPAPVTEAIEASLAIARQRQTERVEQLRVELEAAQRALRELSG